MARLPSEKYLVQRIGDRVAVFESFSEREIASYDVRDQAAMVKAQKTIEDSELSPEDKVFAHFWCGYFWGDFQYGARW